MENDNPSLEGENREGSSVDLGKDEYHDVEEHETGKALALLVNVTLTGGQTLERGEFTARNLAAMILRRYRQNPVSVNIMNAQDAIIEFESSVLVTQIARSLQGQMELSGRWVEIKCVMAGYEHLEQVAREREVA